MCVRVLPGHRTVGGTVGTDDRQPNAYGKYAKGLTMASFNLRSPRKSRDVAEVSRV